MENKKILCNFTNTNKFNTMKKLSKLELTIKATELEDETVDLSVNMNAACTTAFLANAFARLMEQDKIVKEAMELAVFNEFIENMGGEIKKELLKNKMNKEADKLFSNVKAQA